MTKWERTPRNAKRSTSQGPPRINKPRDKYRQPTTAGLASGEGQDPGRQGGKDRRGAGRGGRTS